MVIDTFEILDVIWLSSAKYIKKLYAFKHIGIIFLKTPEKKREIYIGIADQNINEESNIEEIVREGFRLSPISLKKIQKFLSTTGDKNVGID